MKFNKGENYMNNNDLRKAVHALSEEIAMDIHHGECFYDKKMFQEFIDNLEKMKEVARSYFDSNQEN